MQLKFSKGQDESKVTADVNALLESGWELDGKQIGVQKTYHFKTYTKVIVGDLPRSPGISNIARTFTTASECKASPKTIIQK